MENITIGILAGMGPRSTSPFLELVLDQCQAQYGAKADLDYPHIVVYSLPTPFYIDRTVDEDALKDSIKNGLDRLENMGVDLVAIPCNSAHGYVEYITRDVKVPVLNIIKETVKEIKEGSRVSLFATEMTVKTGLYQNGMKQRNCEYVFEEEWQKTINQIILRIKNKSDISETFEEWNKLLEGVMEKKVDTVIIACTDLNVVAKNNHEHIRFIDSSEELAKSLVKEYLEMGSDNEKKNKQ